MKDFYTILDLSKRYGMTKNGVRANLKKLSSEQQSKYISFDNGKTLISANGVKYLDTIISLKETNKDTKTNDNALEPVNTLNVTNDVLKLIDQMYVKREELSDIKADTRQLESNVSIQNQQLQNELNALKKRQTKIIVLSVLLILIAFGLGVLLIWVQI